MSYSLRPYQQEAVDAVLATWASGQNKTVGIAATGAGKTVMFAAIIQREMPELRRQGQRVLVLAHRGELLDQAADKIRRSCPDLRVGIVKGGRDESRMADVVIASVQTLANEKRRARISRIGLVIVDECHLFGAPTFMSVLAHYGCLDGLTRTLGVTATLTRMDGGIDKVWDHVSFEVPITKLIEDGYLVKPYGLTIQAPKMNLGRTKVTAGDLNMKDVAQAMQDSDVFPILAQAYAEHAGDRPGVVFTPDVATAEATVGALTAVGITAETITGAHSPKAREAIYSRYNSGATQVLANAMLLTAGWDSPQTSCVVMARPTINPGLYVQMVGRGLRLHPESGKEDCLILDIAGASQRHKLATVNDLDHVEKKPKKPSDTDDELDGEPKGEREPVEDEYLSRGDLRLSEIDLFTAVRKATRSVWLQTKAGVWASPAGDNAHVFAVPSLTEPGWIWGTALGREFTRKDTGAQPLADALKQAEAFRSEWMDDRGVDDYGQRAARWRKTPASQKQLDLAVKWRLTLPENPTKGDVSDAMARSQASRALDMRFGPHVAKAAEAGRNSPLIRYVDDVQAHTAATR